MTKAQRKKEKDESDLNERHEEGKAAKRERDTQENYTMGEEEDEDEVSVWWCGGVVVTGVIVCDG